MFPGAFFVVNYRGEVKIMSKMNTPGYHLHQNIGFMCSTAWRVCRSVMVLAVLLAVLPPLLMERFYRWQGVIMLGMYAGYVVTLVT